jgi:hypothetical protein
MSTGKAVGVSLAPSFSPASMTAGASSLGHSVGAGLSAAAPAILGAAAAAGALFLTRAALQGLASYAETEANAEQDLQARRSEADRYQQAYAQVAVREARLVQLTQLVTEVSGGPGKLNQNRLGHLPARLVHTGQSPQELLEWCEAIDPQITVLREQLQRERLRVALVARRGESATAHAQAARSLVPRLSALEVELTALPGPSAPPSPRMPTEPVTGSRPAPSEREEVVEHLLRGFAGAVDPDDFGRALDLAERALQPKEESAASMAMNELYLHYQQSLERRRHQEQDALAAAGLLLALESLDRAGPEPETDPFSRAAFREAVRARLRDVVAYRRRMDDELRETASDLAAVAARTAEDRAIAAALAAELGRLGFEVDVPAETEAGVEMSCRGEDWKDHHVRIGVSGTQVTAQMQGTDGSAAFHRHLSDWHVGIRTAVDEVGRRDMVVDELKVIGAPAPPEQSRSAAATDKRRRRRDTERARETPRDSGGDQR